MIAEVQIANLGKKLSSSFNYLIIIKKWPTMIMTEVRIILKPVHYRNPYRLHITAKKDNNTD